MPPLSFGAQAARPLAELGSGASSWATWMRRLRGWGTMSGQMVQPARRNATYQDVLDAPEHLVAEVLAGDLYTHPGPAGPHAETASVLGMDIGSAFHRGRGGPGGWIILYEPELHLGEDIVVPDLAGWRRERMNAVPAEVVRLEPFDAIELELRALWPDTVTPLSEP